MSFSIIISDLSLLCCVLNCTYRYSFMIVASSCVYAWSTSGENILVERWWFELCACVCVCLYYIGVWCAAFLRVQTYYKCASRAYIHILCLVFIESITRSICIYLYAVCVENSSGCSIAFDIAYLYSTHTLNPQSVCLCLRPRRCCRRKMRTRCGGNNDMYITNK